VFVTITEVCGDTPAGVCVCVCKKRERERVREYNCVHWSMSVLIYAHEHMYILIRKAVVVWIFVLQCVAVCVAVCTTVRCSVVQSVAACCSMLERNLVVWTTI